MNEIIFNDPLWAKSSYNIGVALGTSTPLKLSTKLKCHIILFYHIKLNLLSYTVQMNNLGEYSVHRSGDSTRTRKYIPGSNLDGGGIIDQCIGSVPTQHREEYG